MHAGIRIALLAVSATAAVSIHAFAAGPRRFETSRQFTINEPLKNCTRINGRMGYYGNPWCTEAEQELWDRWDARRARRK